MSASYGYIRGTAGKDKEHIDAYIGEHPESERTFVVDQIDPKTGSFDEHKVIMGARSLNEATALYDAHFSDQSGPNRRKAVSEVAVEDFKTWLKEGNTKAEFAGQVKKGERVPAQAQEEAKSGVPTREAITGPEAEAGLRINKQAAEKAKEPLDQPVSDVIGPKKERRTDATRRKTVAAMSPEELRREILTDPLTGLGNRRAYDDTKKLPVQVSVDLDALKWLNDNFGHASGDEMLRAFGEALAAETRKAYRLGGDEFVVQAATSAMGRFIMERVAKRLAGARVEVTLPDGSVVSKTGVGFSYGIGGDYAAADDALKGHKAERERSGQRPGRGAEPPGVERRAGGVVEEPAEGEPREPGGVASQEKSGAVEPAGAAQQRMELEQQRAEGYTGGAEAVKHFDERLSDAGTQAALTRMGENAGWQQRGGQLLRDANHQVTGRTVWIPRESWFAELPEKLNEAATVEAVRKAIAGDALGAKERRVVGYMLDAMARGREEGAVVDEEADAERAAIIAEAERAADMVSDDDTATLLSYDTLNDDELERFLAGEPPQSDRRAEEADASRTEDGDRAPSAQARPAGSIARSRARIETAEEPLLETYTEAELRKREEARLATERRAEEEAAARLAKQEADKARADFVLTGSGREADQLAARGQQSLLDQPAAPETPAEKPPTAPDRATLEAEWLALKRRWGSSKLGKLWKPVTPVAVRTRGEELIKLLSQKSEKPAEKPAERQKQFLASFERDGYVYAVSQRDPTLAILLTENTTKESEFRVATLRNGEPAGHREYEHLSVGIDNAYSEFASSDYKIGPAPSETKPAKPKIDAATKGVLSDLDALLDKDAPKFSIQVSYEPFEMSGDVFTSKKFLNEVVDVEAEHEGSIGYDFSEGPLSDPLHISKERFKGYVLAGLRWRIGEKLFEEEEAAPKQFKKPTLTFTAGEEKTIERLYTAWQSAVKETDAWVQEKKGVSLDVFLKGGKSQEEAVAVVAEDYDGGVDEVRRLFNAGDRDVRKAIARESTPSKRINPELFSEPLEGEKQSPFSKAADLFFKRVAQDQPVVERKEVVATLRQQSMDEASNLLSLYFDRPAGLDLKAHAIDQYQRRGYREEFERAGVSEKESEGYVKKVENVVASLKRELLGLSNRKADIVEKLSGLGKTKGIGHPDVLRAAVNEILTTNAFPFGAFGNKKDNYDNDQRVGEFYVRHLGKAAYAEAIKDPKIAAEIEAAIPLLRAAFLRRIQETEQFFSQALFFKRAAAAKFYEEYSQFVSGHFAGSTKTAAWKYSYAGERGAKVPQHALAAAREYAEQGVPMEEIRKTTGWFRGPDSVSPRSGWRFELSDKDARLKLDWDAHDNTIGDALDHKALFENYPSLAKIDLVFRFGLPANVTGGYAPKDNAIHLNASLSRDGALSTILHELQHAVQVIEGFARGGSPNDKDFISAAASMGIDVNDREAMVSVYRRLLGEVEARDVQARQKLTAAELRERPPYVSQGIPESDFIVRFGGDEAAAISGGQSATELRANLVRRLGSRAIDGLERAGFEIVEREDQLPDEIRPKSGEAVRGVYWKGKSYLVAGSIPEGAELGVLLHEIGVHHGLEGLLGKKLHTALLGNIKAILSPLERAIASGKSEVELAAIRERIARQSPLARALVAARGRVPQETRAGHVVEEVLAYLVEDNANRNLTLVHRVLGAIRAWLLRHGFQLKEVRVEDLVALARASVRAVSRGATVQRGPVGAPDALAVFAKELGVSPEQLRKEYAAVESRYRRTPQWMRAPNGEPTKLNERQWVLARTPRFKEWFGEWEALARRDALKGMTPFIITPGAIGAATSTPEAVRLARETYRGLQTETAETTDGRRVRFGGAGFRETAHHAADRRVLEIIPQLPDLLNKALPLWSDGAPPADRNIKAFHHYGIKTRFASGEAYVRLVVREEVNGDFYYDNDATAVEEIRQASKQPPLPRTKAGARQLPMPVRNRLVAWWRSVNPDTVSKAIDENGEPLVVYHGTRQQFGAFKVGEGGAIFLTANPDIGSAYAMRYGKSKLDSQFDELRARLESQGVGKFEVHNHPEWERLSQEARLLGANVIPTFLAIRQPLEISGEHESEKVNAIKDNPKEIDRLKREGYDGILVRNAVDRPMSYNKGDAGLASQRADMWIAFDPAQIKSAVGNLGSFDPRNPDILFSRQDEQAQLQLVRQAMAEEGKPDARAEVSTRIAATQSGPTFSRAELGADFLDTIATGGGPVKGPQAPLYSVAAPTPPGILDNGNVPRVREWFAPKLDAARVKLQDRFLMLKRHQQAVAARRGLIPENADAYLAQTLYHGRADARLKDLKAAHIDPIIEAIHASGASIDQVEDFLYALHAPSRNRVLVGRNPRFDPSSDKYGGSPGSGMTDDEAAAIIKASREAGLYDKLEAISRQVQALNEAVLQGRISDGLMSEEDADGWRKQWENYVPLRGVDGKDSFPRLGHGFTIKGAESKQAFGRASKAGDLLAHVVSQAEEAIVRGEKNKVGQAFLTFVEENASPHWEVKNIQFKPRIDKDTGELTFERDPFYTLAEDVFSVKRGGKQFHVKLGDPALARSLKNLGAEDSNVVVRTVGALTRALSFLSTTANPEFLISNFARDIQEAGINLAGEKGGVMAKQVMKDVPKALRGAYQAIRKGNTTSEWAKYYHELERSGGLVGYFDSLTVERQAHRLEGMLKDLDPSRPRQAWIALRAVGTFIQQSNQVVESGVRLSAYVNARRAGVSEAQAAGLAKNLTVNFNRRGELGPVMNSLYMFFNAGVQGTARMVQALKHKRTRQIAGGIVGLGVLMEILNQSLSGAGDDEKKYYDKIPQWVKDHNLIMMLPDGEHYMMLPLPYGYNVFHAIGRNFGSMFFGASPLEASQGIVHAGLDAFNPLGGATSLLQFISPTLLDPIVQQAENLSHFGTPIKPGQSPFGPPRPESSMYWRAVNPAAKEVARWLNEVTGGSPARPGGVDISPELIEHWAEFVGGGAGKTLINTLSTGTRLATGQDLPLTKIPFLRRLIGEPDERADAGAYREHINETVLARNEIRYFQQAKDSERAAQVRKNYAAELRLYGLAQATDQRVSALNRRARLLESQGLKSDSIQEQIDKLKMGFIRRFEQATANH